jgi:hypothetical protein
LESDDGKKRMLGCLEWGFYVKKAGRPKDQKNPEYNKLEGTPRTHCGMPPGVKSAIEKWNTMITAPGTSKHNFTIGPLPDIKPAE